MKRKMECKHYISSTVFRSSLWIVNLKAVLFLVLLMLGVSGRNDTKRDDVVVCKTVDIRNELKEFSKLENCTVIEGKLSILLLKSVSRQEMESLSFPKLVEITDYLLLFRVQSLRSLRRLFPNLAVIRGQNLLYAYSLIVFEMPHLEEIGLVNLTLMERGAVRLEKNPNLCYTQTVDWTRIAKSAKPEDHYIRGNKNPSDCIQFCPDYCPVVEKSKEDKTMGKLCWTVNDCQKVCPSDCDYCDNMGKCCNSHCVGGCTGPLSSQCTACKDVLYEGICQKRCPPKTYLFKERRCLTRDQCIEKQNCEPYKLVDGLEGLHPAKCTLSCPSGYTEKNMNCVKCKEKCPKVCSSGFIDSVAAAQRFKDCTVITGPLIIQLMGGTNIGQELEESLGQIEEVGDYIKITRSYPLLSLHFFKSLHTIGGKNLINQYALFVLENLNLQELFLPEVQKKFTIKRGLIFFHMNRKLCYNKIEEFVHQIEPRSEFRMADLNVSVSSRNNGDQATCSMEKIELRVTSTTSFSAVFAWDNFMSGDARQILRYVFSYRESDGGKMDIHQGRDACTVMWKTEDVQSDANDSQIPFFVSGLKPYTQYAAYVETYMISGAKMGAMSDVVMFRTKPKPPEMPDSVRAHGESHSAIVVRWKPPKRPNGNVTYYKVYWKPRETPSMEGLDKKDFCKEPWMPPPDAREQQEEVEKAKKKNVSSVDGQPCCACPKSKKELEKEEQERHLQILFENSVHDTVYKKRHPEVDKSCHRRDKRSAASFFSTDNPFGIYTSRRKLDVTTPMSMTNDNSTIENTTNVTFQHLVAEVVGTHFVITNLSHFTEYSIQIMACQEIDPRTNIGSCGEQAFVTARTSALKSADDIPLESVDSSVKENKTVHNVRVTWLPPHRPNGFVITYELEYRQAKENLRSSIVCIRQQDYTKTGGYDFPALDSGNYSYRIKVSSLAGPGDWTEAKYFVVPEKDEGPKPSIVLIVVSVVIVLFILIIGVIVFLIRNRSYKNAHDLLYTSVNPDYFTSDYTPDEWEIDRDKIKLIQELGQGSFGMVYEGEYNTGNGIKSVAVKTLNDSATMMDRREFLQEASNMKKFLCHHVVRLIGVVSVTQPTFVIMELMGNGDLKNFLRRHRPDDEESCGRQLQVKEILQMAGEIADGMAYLGFKKFVHRDLAARNCMVATNTTVKIGDFGMTRDIYETDYYRKQGKGLLPVRWMPPESLKDGKYSYESDVWSYGVVLWEMATLAAQPYQGLANEQVLKYVLDGKIMDKPEGCPEKLYDLMLDCWHYKARQRPTFLDIIERLIPDLNPSFKDVSYFFSQENNPDNRGDVYTEDCDDVMLDGDVDNAHIPLTNSYGELEPLQFEMRMHRPSNDASVHTLNGRRTAEVEVEAGACADPNRRGSVSSNPPSAISSNGDSKGSSKSSTGSYAHRNGLANGHGPFPQSTLC